MLYDLTLIMPIYNQEKLLSRSLDSIINQTYLRQCRLRVLCIDDGSTDSSSLIIKRYAKKYSFIEYHYKTNGGVSESRNMGLHLVENSRYIGFFDPDDSLELNYLETFMEAAKKNPDGIMFDINLVNKDNFQKKYLTVNSGYNKDIIRGFMISKQATWTRIYRSELYQGVEFPNGVIYEDLAVTPYVASRCQQVVYIKKAIYNYYVNNPGSIMNANSNKKTSNDIYKALNHLFQLFGSQKDYYRDELQYLALEHLCVGHVYRLLQSHNMTSNDINKINEFMITHFGPQWRQNTYLKKGVHKNNINSYLSYVMPQFLWMLDKGILARMIKLSNH